MNERSSLVGKGIGQLLTRVNQKPVRNVGQLRTSRALNARGPQPQMLLRTAAQFRKLWKMLMTRRLSFVLILSAAALAQEKKLRDPDVIFVPTPENVVQQMLKTAKVHKGDIVYDLGCGDGRTVIAAARDFGARGVGIDINPVRIKESLDNAKAAGVTDRVVFRNEDLFEADIKEATVVTLYLLPTLNVKLRPKLLQDLK